MTTARQSTASDAAAIASGIPSRALMQRAGSAAAAEIARSYGPLLHEPVAIAAGPGNNGGDAWVIARALATAGVRVRVEAIGESRTDDARAERALTEPMVELGRVDSARLIIDGLLGTGTRGAPHGAVAECITRCNAARDAGAIVVALDVPSGLDADTGDATHALAADTTLTFGTLKRGLLVARAAAGRIVVLDIGLGACDDGADDRAPALIDERWVFRALPPIAANAHKGIRRRLVIVGGALGMAGAPMLAARAAMRSGIGMVRVLVAPPNLAAVQQRVPYALAGSWPEGDDDVRESIVDWADAVVIGPGLGRTPESRALVERILRAWRGPVLLDADALNVFAGSANELGSLLTGLPALITPHVAEFGRLAGASVADIEARRFEIGAELARTVHAAVLLKGVPTVITGADGERMVSATGTPVLAAAGSGDLLSGIAGTLLAQLENAAAAGACAAWAHGRAAELASEGRATIRGITLKRVERALSDVWPGAEVSPVYPVLAELPAVRDRA